MILTRPNASSHTGFHVHSLAISIRFDKSYNFFLTITFDFVAAFPCYIKVKVHVYNPDISGSSKDFSLITPRYWNSLTQSHLPVENKAIFLRLKPFTHYLFFVLPGNHYCWFYRGGDGWKLVQGYYTWPALWEANPRLLDFGSNALTTRPRALLKLHI